MITQLSAIDIFHTIVNDGNVDEHCTIKYEFAKTHIKSLKMVEHFHPLSITADEFSYFHDFIVTHNLKCGYECATAFGISGLSAALGMKATGGHLVTVDAYIEEKHNLATAYRHLKEVNQNDPDGLKSLRWLMKKFDVENIISPMIGWSPDNVAQAIIDGYGKDATIDYAFIDAGHWDEAVLADALAIRPFVNISKPFAIFFHDLHCFSNNTWDKIYESYGYRMQPLTSIKETWNSGIVTNISF
jgi:hypothetical protein